MSVPPRRQLHIESARDIFEALAHKDEAVRYSILQAIAEYPEKALSYGPWEGQDLVGRLIELAESDPLPMVRSAMIKVLANFRSRRVLDFLKKRMAATSDVDLVFELEPRFAVEPLPAVRDFLLQLMADPVEWPAQALVGARLLMRDDTLAPAQRLRVVLLTDHDIPTPPLDASTLDAWVEELNGPLADRARMLMATLGDSVHLLLPQWDRLGDDTRQWLIDWLVQADATTARAALIAILRGPLTPHVACVALQHLEAAGAEVEALGEERALAWLQHDASTVRASAIEAGLGSPAQLQAIVRDPTQPSEVRMAVLRRWHRHPAEADQDALLALLVDSDWRLRSAAAEALIVQGESICDRVMGLLENGPEQARPPAARILMSLRGEDWLQEELLALRPG